MQLLYKTGIGVCINFSRCAYRFPFLMPDFIVMLIAVAFAHSLNQKYRIVSIYVNDVCLNYILIDFVLVNNELVALVFLIVWFDYRDFADKLLLVLRK